MYIYKKVVHIVVVTTNSPDRSPKFLFPESILLLTMPQCYLLSTSGHLAMVIDRVSLFSSRTSPLIFNTSTPTTHPFFLHSALSSGIHNIT